MPNVPFPKLDIGGRSLILHKIEAKKKELDIVVASILEQLAPIEEYCNVVIFYEVKTAVENFKAGKVKFEDCSKIFSDIDDRVVLTVDVLSRAVIEFKGDLQEVCDKVPTAGYRPPPPMMTLRRDVVLKERLARRESELTMNFETLQACLRTLRGKLESVPCGYLHGDCDPLRIKSQSLSQLENLYSETCSKVDEKISQLLKVWECLGNWEVILKEGEQVESDDHRSCNHGWTRSLQGDLGIVLHQPPQDSSSEVAGLPHHLNVSKGAVVADSDKELKKEGARGNFSNSSLSIPKPEPCVLDEAKAHLNRPLDSASELGSKTSTKLTRPHSPAIGSTNENYSEHGSGKLSTAPDADMLPVVEMQRKKLMKKLHASFGVWGQALSVGQDYPGHQVVFQEGNPARFWVNFETNARQKLQDKIQDYIDGAEPVHERGVRAGDLVLARYQDRKVYRAIVIGVADGDASDVSFSLRYIDFGNLEHGVLRSNLYNWNPLLEEIPPQAICVRIRGTLDTQYFSNEQLKVFDDVMSNCGPYSMVVHERLLPLSNNFCQNWRLSSPEVEVSLASRTDVNIVTTLASYPLLADIFREENTTGPLLGPFQAASGLRCPAALAALPSGEPASCIQPGVPSQPADDKVSRWLEGLPSEKEDCEQTMNEKDDKVKASPDNYLKNETSRMEPEEPELVADEANKFPYHGEFKSFISAVFLDQQVVELDEKRRFSFLLAHLEHPGNIWLHPLQDTSITWNLNAIESELESSVLHQLNPEDIVPTRSCWAVSVDVATFPSICACTWVRVRVEKEFEDGKVAARSLDYGNLVEIPKDHLHHLPSGAASTLPGIAVSCLLAGIVPPTCGWTEEGTQSALKMLDLENEMVAYAPALQEGGNLEVVIYLPGPADGAKGEVTLNGELLRFGHALPCRATLDATFKGDSLTAWDPLSMDYNNNENNYVTNDDDLEMATQGYKSKTRVCQFFQNRGGHCWKGEHCQDLHQLAREGAVTVDQEEVIVVDQMLPLALLPANACLMHVLLVNVTNPSTFYLRFPNGMVNASHLSPEDFLRNYSLRHQQFKTSLSKFYEENPKLLLLSSLPAPGNVIVVKENNGWERAVVLEFTEGGEDLFVFLVDEGSTACVRLNKIRSLHPEFSSLDYQAVHCQLAAVEPLGGTWSLEATKFLRSLIGATNLRAEMKCPVVELTRSTRQLVQLIDGEEKNVEDLLVKHGWARQEHREASIAENKGYKSNLCPN